MGSVHVSERSIQMAFQGVRTFADDTGGAADDIMSSATAVGQEIEEVIREQEEYVRQLQTELAETNREAQEVASRIAALPNAIHEEQQERDRLFRSLQSAQNDAEANAIKNDIARLNRDIESARRELNDLKFEHRKLQDKAHNLGLEFQWEDRRLADLRRLGSDCDASLDKLKDCVSRLAQQSGESTHICQLGLQGLAQAVWRYRDTSIA